MILPCSCFRASTRLCVYVGGGGVGLGGVGVYVSTCLLVCLSPRTSDLKEVQK